MKNFAFVLVIAACGSNNPAPAPALVPVVPSAGPSAAPSGATGKVVERTFHSDALGVDKHYLVYLPASYDDKPTAKWPVFYYLHGLGGSEKTWIKGHIDQAADKLGLQALIVMPDGDDGFYADSAKTTDYDACMKNGTGLLNPTMQDPASTCVKHFSYETYIIKDLIADVDAHYHTNATGQARGIAGMSMGGLGAWELGLRHPELFAAAASHSGYIGMLYKGPHPYEKGMVELSKLDDTRQVTNPMVQWVVSIFGTDLANWKAHDPEELITKMTPGKPALYLDCGTEDEFHFQDATQYIHDVLTVLHLEHAYFIGRGGHDFGFWGPREIESLKWLQEHVAKP